MFDLGWQEFLMVAVVLMLVVGPKDLPRILRSFSQIMRKAKSMAREFTSSLEDVARHDEFKDMKEMLYDVKEGNFDEMANIIGGDLKQAAEDVKSSAGLDDANLDEANLDKDDQELSKKANTASSAPKSKPAKKTASKKKTAKKVAKKAAKKVAKKQ